MDHPKGATGLKHLSLAHGAMAAQVERVEVLPQDRA